MATRIAVWIYILGGILTISAFCGGIAGGYFRLLGSGPAFGLFVLGMLGGVIISLAGLIDLARNGAQPRTAVLVMGLIPAAMLIYSAISGRQYPMINDVTTDLVYPPQFIHALTLPENEGLEMNFPAEFEDVIESEYGDLMPLALNHTIDDVHMATLNAVNGLSNWKTLSTDISTKEIVLEGIVTSEVFGFVDDFVIRIESANSGGCVVDMRSRSRMGKGDFGQNAAHIRLLFETIKL
ncbi:MAG: DUF1499 domain-containing protein [Candidatus Hydrogenedentota bacterium]